MDGTATLSGTPVGITKWQRRAFKWPALLFLGSLLIQSAWLLALPPFRGTDEFDHAYRAAEVALGDWHPQRVAATDGRGDLVVVPRSLVTAAQPVCASYEYTGPDNCTPVAGVGNDNVLIASAAAAYNPVFYWVVGTAAKPFDGAAALYVMRLVCILLCAVFIALAGWVTSLWARTAWPIVGMLVAMTPVMMFSVSIVAPNGLEMCAALSLWMALLGLTTREGRDVHAARLLVTATLGAIVLTTLRSIGPLWVALIVLMVALLLGPNTIGTIGRRHRALVLSCVVLVATATLASLGWTRAAGTQRLAHYDVGISSPVLAALDQVPLWLLQGVAAYPRRGNAAPPLVYVLVALVYLMFLFTAFSRAPRRLRLILVACQVIAVAVPLTLTIPTIDFSGPFWQGRYGLPFHMGLALLAGLALDAAPAPRLARAPILVSAWLSLAVANVLGIEHVLKVEMLTSPLAGASTWFDAPAWVIAVLVLAGFTAWGLAVSLRRQHGATPDGAAGPDISGPGDDPGGLIR